MRARRRQGLGAGLVLAALAACGGGEPQAPVDPARARLNAEVAEVRRTQGQPPDSPLLHFQLGLVFERYGVLDSAAAAYGRAVAAHAAFPQAHYQLGQVQYQRGQVPEAIASYRQAVRYDPDYAEAYNNLGFLLKASGDLDGAETAYLQALRCDSTFAQARNNLGQVYKERRQWDLAVACYRQALQAAPQMEEAYLNLAMAYQEAGRPEDERAALEEMTARFPGTRRGAYAAGRLAELKALE